MAEVRLSDVVVPEVFDTYVNQNTMVKSEVYRSGLLVSDAQLSSKLAGGGLTFNAPAWGDLADTDPDTSSDDPADLSVPDKIGTFTEIAGRMTANKSWATMNFASELAGSDAANRIGDRVADWYGRLYNRWAINTALGVLGANVANNGSDMVYDAGAASMSGATTLNAGQRLGDAKEKLSILLVHSQTLLTMQKQQLLTNAFVSEDKISANPMMMYMNKYRVVVDDSLPNGNPKTSANPGGGASFNGTALAANEFISFLSAPGTIAMGTTSHKMPVETDTVPAAGGGSGEELLYTRRIMTLHPRGHVINMTGLAKTTPNLDEVALSARWSRVYPEMKQMGIVAIKTTET